MPKVRAKGNKFELCEDYNMKIDYFVKECLVYIPKGFIFDFASMPKGLMYMLGYEFHHETIAEASLVHDWLYEKKGEVVTNDNTKLYMSRKDVDTLFFNTMIQDGMEKWKAEICYRAVRVCGWLYWRG